MNARILTFNWHESYIHLLAKTGYEFDVVEVWKGGRYGWIKEFRPVPPNCHLISEEDYGILDRTHLRFFARKDMERLFTDAGLELTGITANIDPSYYSLNDPLSGNIAFGRVSLSDLSPEELKDLFVVQYLIRAQKTGHLVDETSERLRNARDTEGLSKIKDKLEEHLKLHPADLDANFRYAEVCYRLGLLDEAIEKLDNILIFEPDRRDALKLRKQLIESKRSH